MVAGMSGWGTPLPEGFARGIAIDDRRRPSRNTVALCAEVVTVSLSRGGLLRLERVDVVFDEGFSFVNASLPCRVGYGDDRPRHSQATDLQTNTTVKRGTGQASDLQGGGIAARRG